ncbi:hypothetical protein B0T24DRAFT_685538 [Lasiosphaeria ovina]|uniref:GIT Spa2 homology (SHD) domain-containing protein n=1 Tax=Lasiosphaeria ovina TaxID=92902 RepID=A0AAE0JRI1_9PEZI|nr:hypothetical protein B0T24DRAFT_685538 [Lasiosphaeria ovina]
MLLVPLEFRQALAGLLDAAEEVVRMVKSTTTPSPGAGSSGDVVLGLIGSETEIAWTVDDADVPLQPGASWPGQMRALSREQLKNLCADAYDELVRRNKADAYGPAAVTAALVPVDELPPPRNRARGPLARLDDAAFLCLISDCYRELERRGRDVGCV